MDDLTSYGEDDVCYYGSLKEVPQDSEKFGSFLLNEMFNKIFKESENKINKMQKEIIADFRQEAKKDIKSLKDELREALRRIEKRFLSAEKEIQGLNVHKKSIRSRMEKVEIYIKENSNG